MSSFLNISRKEAKKIHFEVYANAASLKKDALTLVTRNNSFGSATSLMILSSEELVKAILLCLHGEGYEIHKLKDAKRFYKNHEVRHQIVQLLEVGSSIYESIKKYDEQRANPKFSIKNKFWNNIINGLSIAAEISGTAIKSTEKIKMLQNFNNLKNAGLYSDYIDTFQTPKKCINQSDFENVRTISETLKIHYKQLRILHHPRASKLISNQELVQYKETLQIFIDKAINDFEFKSLK